MPITVGTLSEYMSVILGPLTLIVCILSVFLYNFIKSKGTILHAIYSMLVTANVYLLVNATRYLLRI